VCADCKQGTYATGQRETACLLCQTDKACGDCDRATGFGIPKPGYCAMGAHCIAAGTVNPGNVCTQCLPGVSINTYTPVSGTRCVDGLISTYNDCEY
jgi:hypothetical protein